MFTKSQTYFVYFFLPLLLFFAACGSKEQSSVPPAPFSQAHWSYTLEDLQELEQTAQGLRRSLARAERASRYRTVSRQEDRTSSFQPTALQKDGVTGSAGVEARQVDRVFERDARRYDNRFTLF